MSCPGSPEEKQFVLQIGPPIVPPNWLRLIVSRFVAKAFRALNIPFRTNSNRSPWNVVRSRFRHQAHRTGGLHAVLAPTWRWSRP